MQLGITLSDPDNLIPKIKKLGTGQAMRIQNFVVACVAKDYADYQKGRYLNGQYLRRQTSETYNSVKFYKLKEGAFVVRPGVGVPGQMNYLSVFEDKYGKPFVTDSKNAYDNSGRVEIIQRREWTKVLKKKGLI